MCGENPLGVALKEEGGGSSPRVRGKLRSACEGNEFRGLIPACAGKTWCGGFALKLQWAHPRVCGENSRSKLVSASRSGSSPRVRGKLVGGCCALDCLGLIPACAGKTPGDRPRSRPRPAHPRVCGENAKARTWSGVATGSSPRVRGKLEAVFKQTADKGLIPACAGKTQAASLQPFQAWAHPRVCGENHDNRGKRLGNGGSSPRVRGKHAKAAELGFKRGLIPACAGKT